MWLTVVAHRVVSSSNRDGSRCRVHEGCSCLSVAMSAFLPMCLSDITDTLWNVDNLFPLALGRQHSSLHDAVALAWSLYQPACLSVCVYTTVRCQLVHPSVCVSACLRVPLFMSAWLLAVQVSVCLFVCLPACLSICLPLCLPACLFDRHFLACLPACLFDM